MGLELKSDTKINGDYYTTSLQTQPTKTYAFLQYDNSTYVRIPVLYLQECSITDGSLTYGDYYSLVIKEDKNITLSGGISGGTTIGIKAFTRLKKVTNTVHRDILANSGYFYNGTPVENNNSPQYDDSHETSSFSLNGNFTVFEIYNGTGYDKITLSELNSLNY